MNRIILILTTLIIAFASCKKNEVDGYSSNAIVQKKGMDCGNSFLIKFDNDVVGLPENNFDNIFYETNLSNDYKIEGKRIFVEFREPENEEKMICSTQGITYPQIYITKAE